MFLKKVINKIFNLTLSVEYIKKNILILDIDLIIYNS